MCSGEFWFNKHSVCISDQLCHLQGSGQSENMEPLVGKVGKSFFFSVSLLTCQGFSFAVWCCMPSGTGDLRRPGQTPKVPGASSGDSHAGFVPSLTFPANKPGPHWEWRVAVAVGQAEEGEAGRFRHRGQGVGSWGPFLEAEKGQKWACVWPEASETGWVLHWPWGLPLLNKIIQR